jgi:acetyltransferase-like isoleucine patch superfamily enzyme
VVIGRNFIMNNAKRFNLIGRHQRCSIQVTNEGRLTIGDNVGISFTAIVCSNEISIGNNVKIGGNVAIYDTDFHSLVAKHRTDKDDDVRNAKSSPVVIEDNVFVGAHSTILKGVTIGKNSVIGACSVVSKNVPPNEIWAGNPATFIKNVPE